MWKAIWTKIRSNGFLRRLNHLLKETYDVHWYLLLQHTTHWRENTFKTQAFQMWNEVSKVAEGKKIERLRICELTLQTFLSHHGLKKEESSPGGGCAATR